MSASTENRISTGLDPDRFYPLVEACQLAGIGKNHMLQIKRRYKGNGVHAWGNDFCIYGRDLIKIVVEESQQDQSTKRKKIAK
ncbi:hypothetical protein [Gimesia chilikensis]|uniref:hypothetical protein n=1 Tax=Gimesia chilikensis TaxID=2605989 RepID=UPI003A8CE43C